MKLVRDLRKWGRSLPSSTAAGLSHMQFNKGPLYGFSAKVKNWLLSKYYPQKEAELRSWMKGLKGLSIGPDFQKGLRVEVILCALMNKLQLGSVPKVNCFMQHWHQLENLSNFIKAMISLNSADLRPMTCLRVETQHMHRCLTGSGREC